MKRLREEDGRPNPCLCGDKEKENKGKNDYRATIVLTVG